MRGQNSIPPLTLKLFDTWCPATRVRRILWQYYIVCSSARNIYIIHVTIYSPPLSSHFKLWKWYYDNGHWYDSDSSTDIMSEIKAFYAPSLFHNFCRNCASIRTCFLSHTQPIYAIEELKWDILILRWRGIGNDLKW